MRCWHLVSVAYKWGPSGLAGVYYHPCILFSIVSPGDVLFGSTHEPPAAGRFRGLSQSLILSAVGYLGAFRSYLRAI